METLSNVGATAPRMFILFFQTEFPTKVAVSQIALKNIEETKQILGVTTSKSQEINFVEVMGSFDGLLSTFV